MRNEDPELVALGLRLRTERIKRNETQAMFAARLGVRDVEIINLPF